MKSLINALCKLLMWGLILAFFASMFSTCCRLSCLSVKVGLEKMEKASDEGFEKSRVFWMTNGCERAASVEDLLAE